MFCRQLKALLIKNFLIKRRNLKKTIWEFILPLLCGLLAGAYQVDVTSIDKSVSPVEMFGQISMMYLVSLTLISISFSGACTFLLNQVVIDKETKMKESLKIMSIGRLPYSLSYFISQGVFCYLEPH